MIRRQPRHLREETDEQGQIMVLLIGFVLIVLLIVTVIAAAGSVYLGHKKLLSMADSAALAAADTFELSGGSASTDPGTLLTTPGVVAAAQNSLASADIPAGLSGIVVDAGTGAADSHTAKVSLSAVVHPLFINFLVPQGINITVTSTARANLLL
ncbi:pilus assembly protein TadG-related protein [Arthrobacter psychrolactophilus]|uniref:pilus assembly protein TadG-related protein n=1 Tax=Arthrobacter psychrolactophilus TaxID=92442 RepID=UPI001FE89B99|nr:pilus assembly protein TadG-related protein [Arthrobacter psychrolactophilus]